MTIATTGFSQKQSQQLTQTLTQLGCLQPKELKIPSENYTRLSRFKEYFGFELGEGKLADWLANRIRTLRLANTWTTATNNGEGHITIGQDYFKSSLLEQMYILVHEARHSDASSPSHVDCPDDFPYIALGDSRLPAGLPACDSSATGAYGYQAAFVFELYAFGLVSDQRSSGAVYNATMARILSTPPSE